MTGPVAPIPPPRPDVWAINSVIGSGSTTGAKLIWVLLVLVLPIVGFIIWLMAGPRGAR
ncbi:PLDc N-terminal domain-containing protein [Pseudooceanicola sp.]|uniref:PLDc N-terminal domain-containing protein n=1 Tax=Pseudooceanicola sp. TaxID=1914328 RepID=UPI00262C9DC3|nr:PLDc N-terminal domain-containing protein [Pseudooceanicola sp.]MDF1854578.1 PLDc N-terminal domain-containing protein [Pseudooceanicola sp.]